MFFTENNCMKMMSRKLAMPLLGVLLWVISIHAGTFATATLLPPPITGTSRTYTTFFLFSLYVRVVYVLIFFIKSKSKHTQNSAANYNQLKETKSEKLVTFDCDFLFNLSSVTTVLF